MDTAIDSITPDFPPSGAMPGLAGTLPDTLTGINETQTPEQDNINNIQKSIDDEEQKTLNDFNHARIYLNSLISEWRTEEQRTEGQRLTRDVEFNVDQLRESGDIDDDECFIPQRIIDQNIQREMPSYINFLKNSRRLITFQDILDETFDTDRLEEAFTEGMTYKGWTKPHFKVLDGCMTHAWACMEVVYDTRYPLHCGLEYIAHEDLIFPCDSKDLQASSVILRRYCLTPLQLKNFVANFGFDLDQVNRIIEKQKDSNNKDKTIEVFKRFCKYQGVVFVSWFSIVGACTDWLKKPMKLYTGIDTKQTVMKDMPTPQPIIDPSTGAQVGVQNINVPTPTEEWVAQELANYPVFLLPYRETEKPLIFDYIGRVTLDKDKQEAQTAVLTAFINRMNRSQKVFGSPSADTVNDGRPAKQLANVQWKDGTIWDKPFAFWQMPPPDPTVLKALDWMETSNSQDIGQTNFAAINREDSRKTATEITAAENAENLLNSVDLTLYSEFIRELYSFAWLIVRSQALQNKIKFLLIEDPAIQQQQAMSQQQSMAGAPLPMPSMAPPSMSIVDSLGTYQQEQSQYINDADTIVREFDIRAAGDVDVIQKQAMTQSMQQDWPVIQQTPIANQFLSDYLRLKYPQNSAVYSRLLMQGSVKNNVIKAMGTILQQVMTMPEVSQHLNPQMIAGLKQVEAEATQALETP